MPQQARPKDIRIICGLGNPGPEYASTRHNAGFATVDALAEHHGARYWKSEAGCMVARCTMRAPEGTREVLLAKPQDYMNTSGGPLSKLLRQEKASAQEVLVVHDEVDFAAGTVNVKFLRRPERAQRPALHRKQARHARLCAPALWRGAPTRKDAGGRLRATHAQRQLPARVRA